MRQLYLHAGMPKTGTTFVQSVLHASADRLAAQGLTLLPATRKGSHQLSVAVRGGTPGPGGPWARQPLRRFARRLASAQTPRILMSDELLAGATSEQIARLLEAAPDVEPHLVLSLRGLSRLLPSTWQQRVQQRGESPPLEEFLETITSRQGALARQWWDVRGVVPVVERWAQFVPLERMHVVTVPGPGTDPRDLLERHAAVLGIDPSTLDREAVAARQNRSLGWAQAEVLRQVKSRIPPELFTKQGYLRVGKSWLGARHLAVQDGAPPRMPEALRAWCEEEADQTIGWLAQRPIEVAGDLRDLRPGEGDFVADARLEPSAIAEAAIEALTSIAAERTRARLGAAEAAGQDEG